MKKVERQKKKYTLFTGKQLLWLILPIVIEQIFSTSLGFFDSLIVSNIPGDGSNISNAVGNVDYINNLIIQLFSAFATGGAIVTSQFLGAGDNENANRSAKQVLMLVICISLGIGGLSLALNWPLLKLLYSEVEADVFRYMQLYFYITAASFPFIGLFNACAALLRAQRKSMVTMVSAAISCFVNIGLDLLLIFVFDMGVIGAGLATLFCRAIPAIFMLVLLGKRSNTVCVRIFEKFRFDGKIVKRILKIAIPSGIESALFQLGKLMTNTFVNIGYYAHDTAIVNPATGTLINVQANGNTIANQINNYASVVGGGVGTSCITVIGQAVGAGDADQVKYYMKRMFLLSYIANGICVAVILGLVPAIVPLYGYVAEAKAVGKQCLYFCLIFQFFTYPLSFTTPGILKATSDVKYVMYCAIISMFVMRVGLSFLMTTDKIPGLPKLGAMGYWIGMCSDWVLRSVLFFSRLLSGRWKKASGLIKEKPAGEAAAVAVGAGAGGAAIVAETLPDEFSAQPPAEFSAESSVEFSETPTEEPAVEAGANNREGEE